MNRSLDAALREAMRLMRTQKLAKATQAIGKALGTQAAPGPGLEALSAKLREQLGRGGPAPGPEARQGRRPPVPPGAELLDRRFASPAGARRYTLYVPAKGKGTARPLIVMLHGCTQDPDDFALGTRMNAVAEELGALVAYPAQDASANRTLCWNWFDAAHQRRGVGEPAIIAGIVQEVIARFRVDPARVFVAGLSAGGAMAAVMGGVYPDLFAGVGVHSGLPHGAAHDLPSALGAMRNGAAREVGGARRPGRVPRLIVFHGDGDSTVHPDNGARLLDRVRGETGRPPRVERGARNGRAFTRTTYFGRDGTAVAEDWQVHGLGHAWSGGSRDGSHADPSGPDASREMLRFFLTTPERAG